MDSSSGSENFRVGLIVFFLFQQNMAAQDSTIGSSSSSYDGFAIWMQLDDTPEAVRHHVNFRPRGFIQDDDERPYLSNDFHIPLFETIAPDHTCTVLEFHHNTLYFGFSDGTVKNLVIDANGQEITLQHHWTNMPIRAILPTVLTNDTKAEKNRPRNDEDNGRGFLVVASNRVRFMDYNAQPVWTYVNPSLFVAAFDTPMGILLFDTVGRIREVSLYHNNLTMFQLLGRHHSRSPIDSVCCFSATPVFRRQVGLLFGVLHQNWFAVIRVYHLIGPTFSVDRLVKLYLDQFVGIPVMMANNVYNIYFAAKNPNEWRHGTSRVMFFNLDDFKTLRFNQQFVDPPVQRLVSIKSSEDQIIGIDGLGVVFIAFNWQEGNHIEKYVRTIRPTIGITQQAVLANRLVENADDEGNNEWRQILLGISSQGLVYSRNLPLSFESGVCNACLSFFNRDYQIPGNPNFIVACRHYSQNIN